MIPRYTMSRVLLFAGTACTFVALAWVAPRLAASLGVSAKVAYLLVIVCVSCIASLGIAWQRYRLRKALAALPLDLIEALAEESPEIRYAFAAEGSRSTRLTVLVGVVLVNGPLIPIMIGPIFALQTWFVLEPPAPQFVALLLGFLLAWLWWSIAMSNWRNWAIAGGMTPGEVQWRGQGASLLWPRGHFFERTEWQYLVQKRQRNGQ